MIGLADQGRATPCASRVRNSVGRTSRQTPTPNTDVCMRQCSPDRRVCSRSVRQQVQLKARPMCHQLLLKLGTICALAENCLSSPGTRDRRLGRHRPQAHRSHIKLDSGRSVRSRRESLILWRCGLSSIAPSAGRALTSRRGCSRVHRLLPRTLFGSRFISDSVGEPAILGTLDGLSSPAGLATTASPSGTCPGSALLPD